MVFTQHWCDKMLETADFKKLVSLAPLFAIDLVLLNDQQQILLGKRTNSPAKDYWFVPGGRVFKNESLAQAFARISHSELGFTLELAQAQLIGLYDHFYQNSFVDEQLSTHYINATHLVKGIKLAINDLPKSQHQEYQWVGLNQLEGNSSVHNYSKIFLPDLNKLLAND